MIDFDFGVWAKWTLIVSLYASLECALKGPVYRIVGLANALFLDTCVWITRGLIWFMGWITRER